MSYIRCLSNPEGLYIWDDGDVVTFSHGVKPPLSSGIKEVGDVARFTIPSEIFIKVHARCKQGFWDEPVEVDGMSVRQEYIYLDTASKIPSQTITEMCEDKKARGYRIRVQYKEHFVYLWPVTWAYVVKSH